MVQDFEAIKKVTKFTFFAGPILVLIGLILPIFAIKISIITGFVTYIFGILILVLGIHTYFYNYREKQRKINESRNHWHSVDYGSEDVCPTCGKTMYIDITGGRLDDIVTHCDHCDYTYVFSAGAAIVQVLAMLSLIPYFIISFYWYNFETMTDIPGIYGMYMVFTGFIVFFFFVPTRVLIKYVEMEPVRKSLKEKSQYFYEREQRMEGDENYRERIGKEYSGQLNLLIVFGIVLALFSIIPMYIGFSDGMSEMDYKSLFFQPMIFAIAFMLLSMEKKSVAMTIAYSEKYVKTIMAYAILLYGMAIFVMLAVLLL